MSKLRKFKIGQDVYTLDGSYAGKVVDGYNEIVFTIRDGVKYSWCDYDLKEEK